MSASPTKGDLETTEVEILQSEAEAVPLVLKTLMGKTIHVMVSLHRTGFNLKETIQDMEGIPPNMQRLVGGTPCRELGDDETLASLGIKGGDTVFLYLKLTGDIGVFVSDRSLAPLPGPDGAPVAAMDAPGAAWLASASLPSPPPCAADVAAVVARVLPAGATSGSDVWGSGDSVFGGDVAAALVALVDAAWQRAHAGGGGGDARTEGGACSGWSALARRVAAGSTADDFKLLLRPAALREAVGAHAYGRLLAALNPPPRAGAATPDEEEERLRREPDAVALRRTTPSGRWIGFHADDAARTVQVPLSGDADCEGGRLVFALPSGELVPAQRRVGAILAHDGDAVHGVTRLTRGMRYGLFLLRQRADTALPTPALVA